MQSRCFCTAVAALACAQQLHGINGGGRSTSTPCVELRTACLQWVKSTCIVRIQHFKIVALHTYVSPAFEEIHCCFSAVSASVDILVEVNCILDGKSVQRLSTTLMSGTVLLFLCHSGFHQKMWPWQVLFCLVSEAAGRVKLPSFKPKQGVHIETDPKGTAKPIANGDDTAVIEDLISQLEVLHD